MRNPANDDQMPKTVEELHVALRDCREHLNRLEELLLKSQKELGPK